jgi:hypothetical protein
MSIESLENKEIAVLVLSTRNERYDSFREAVYLSWFKELKDKGVNCYFYAGDYPMEKIVEDTIELKESDLLSDTAIKLVAAIDVLIRTHPEIKLIYRTNLSSYIEPSNFLKYIKHRQLARDSYCGVVGSTTLFREKFYGNWWLYNIVRLLRLGRPIKFASGSGFFVGVDLAKKLIEMPSDLSLIDDVMVANTLGISPHEYQVPLRFDILDEYKHVISRSKYLGLVRDELLFHYRFKTSDRIKDASMLRNFSDQEFRLMTCVGKTSE